MRFVFLALALLAYGAVAMNESAPFEKAITAFDSGNYNDAISGFSEVLAADGGSATAHYDLGSAYYRNKQLGLALFHFRKALELLPRDPEIRFNLNYLRQKTVDKINRRGLIPDLDAILPLSERETYGLLVFFSIGFGVTGILGFVFNENRLRWTRRGFLILTLAFLGLCAEKSLFKRDFGVVTSAEADVYSALGKDNVLLFQLHEGAEFSVGDAGPSDWVQIVLADGKKGWMKKKDGVF